MHSEKQINMIKKQYHLFLEDLVSILKDEIKNKKKEREHGDFSTGMLHELYQILLKLQHIAQENNIPLHAIGLTDIADFTYQKQREQKPVLAKYKKSILDLILEIQTQIGTLEQAGNRKKLFTEGRLQSCYAVLNIIQQQAVGFQIDINIDKAYVM